MYNSMQNFVTGEWEPFPDPLTDEKAKQFIPQEMPFQRLYDLYRLKGLSPLDAMIEVLRLATGEKKNG